MSIKAGCAKKTITPELPCYLAGYGVLDGNRNATYIKDDLYVSVISITDRNDQSLIFVSCDLISMTEQLGEKALSYLNENHGINTENVIICATHTHTGPEIREYALPAGQHHIDFQKKYIAYVQEQILEAVKEAVENPFAATVHVGQAEAKSIAHNRLYRIKDGSEVFGIANEEVAGQVAGPAGDVDSSVQTLGIIDSEQKLRAVAINFACHPDIIGGGGADFVSADWPGVTARCFEAVYGDDFVCLILQGCAGDINQSDYRKHQLPNAGELKTLQVGRAIAGAAMLAVEKSSLDAIDVGDIAGNLEYLAIPYVEITQAFKDYIVDLSTKENLTGLEKSLLNRFPKWDKEGMVDSIPIKCFKIGDIGFVGMAGEIFTRWGLETKKYSPTPQTFIIELCACHDGLGGYKCSTDQALRGAAGRGAYGSVPTVSRRHCIDAGRLMTEGAISNLHKLWDQN